ncbi:MAG: putative DNA binding domain-containing protein [Gracilibacteraceae bacterium]|jgi:ATP-dependent DNA helicase RecG|nr:putative DNA binding domain-containing protein [Gracilibacteraceae bacterium]
MKAKLEQLLRDGEGLTIEFKRCTDELPRTVYETVCSFSNRYGGYILLGVEDDGTVTGVSPDAVQKIKKNFSTSLNNPQRFAPTLFIGLEEAELDGKTILWCHIPVDSQVVMFGGKIFDRAEDGDIDITRNSTTVTHIHQRKTAEYSERKIFPYAKDSDFDFARLMPLVRTLVGNQRKDHPWEKMSDGEILKSAGLYQSDLEIGKSGYNLAAVMLFGRDELIRACTPNYVTDAICRRENLDRYDDRLLVTANLIDAYDQLIEFITKHTLDRFFLIGEQRVSVRSWIARELVSNILVHREYTSAFPAKIIIEQERIVTENWCVPRNPGRIDPEMFTPYPKNPLLANFFINIGRADVLGSGVRNLYKYTKIYSGGEPELLEGDVFRSIVPLSLSDISDGNGHLSDKMSDKVSDKPGKPGKSGRSGKSGDPDKMSDKPDKVSDKPDKMSDKPDKMSDKNSRDILLAYLIIDGEVTAAEAAAIIGKTARTARRILQRLVDDGAVVSTGANRNRKYKAAR